ncbi:hypothetical protein BCU84_00570 [Shewanella sp. 10N.286.51.B7]|uniref:PH domain-containing protein n=1 Tax=Shewanella sp. 10N.286.51.B7 TaxID=1880836 RepID=UPI000CC1A69C|nr:PH domain-containing protein [Shewanella sp. 10N.286.51.B7]PMG80981.1 hypothetical protein BCU84_00570 [Shewanella sp. 10N.286.51.B7]
MTSTSDLSSNASTAAATSQQLIEQGSEHAETPTDKTLLTQSQWQPYSDLSLSAVDKNYPKQIAIQTSGLVVVIIAIIMFIMNIDNQAGISHSLTVFTVLSLLGAGLVSLKHKAAKNLGYGVLEHELVVRKGLWWISTTTLPFTRLQHVSLSQNPLQRRFSLATLKCFSAGSGAAEIYLPGLLFDTAEHLRQHLLHQATAYQSKQSSDTSLQTEQTNQHLTPNDNVIESEHGIMNQDLDKGVDVNVDVDVDVNVNLASETSSKKAQGDKQDD